MTTTPNEPVSDDDITWNAGVSYAISDVYTVDLRYHDTDVDISDIAEARAVVSLKAAF